ncbi:MFS transporter [Streptomyces silvisoli]|uniref:MFS transporter n=1 Tax=Streptomyces silvisoli TaxID=3034235 RepID=A0ABT5ZGX2_9ACTN|nr:MFS transporter [Streptomyces silvisoli]MDF3289067.1 MFS transporter [Streptomyces silvisoli]
MTVQSPVSTVSFLLVGLPAGAWVDRWLKRPTMMLAALIRSLVVLAIPWLWFAGKLEIWHLYAVATLVGLVTVFFDVAYQSYVPILVSDGDVGRANARLEATSQLATTGGPALSGLFMRVVSAPVLMLGDALSYFVSFGCLALTKDSEVQQRLEAGPRRALAAEIGEGLRFVRDQPVIRRLVVAMGFSNLFVCMVSTLMPILVLRTMGLDAFMLGVVMTCGSIGGVLGASLAPMLRRRLSDGTVIAGGLVAAAVFVMVNPVAGLISRDHRNLGTVLLTIAEFCMTAAALVYNVTQVSLRQSLCPKHLLGRMNASIRFVVWGSIPISALLAGWLSSLMGVVPTLWVGGIGSLLTALPVLGIGRLIPVDQHA